MNKRTAEEIDLARLGRTLQLIGQTGKVIAPLAPIGDLLVELQLALVSGDRKGSLIATNRLFAIAPTRNANSAVRKVLSLNPDYRLHLLTLALQAVNQLNDDQSLAETVEQLDQLSPEMLKQTRKPTAQTDALGRFEEWDMSVWQAPDSITFLSKIVESPAELAPLSDGPVIGVGFDWLLWETPPIIPTPAPWADPDPLKSSIATARHPFWGAMVATLDACTGDYEWQSLILRGRSLKSRHRSLGEAELALDQLWCNELGLYPAPPLIVPDEVPFVPGKPLHWLPWSLEKMEQHGIAVESEGSWRLTDYFRSQLMKDDEHMIVFEAIRQRSFRLAKAAEALNKNKSEVA